MPDRVRAIGAGRAIAGGGLPGAGPTALACGDWLLIGAIDARGWLIGAGWLCGG